MDQDDFGPLFIVSSIFFVVCGFFVVVSSFSTVVGIVQVAYLKIGIVCLVDIKKSGPTRYANSVLLFRKSFRSASTIAGTYISAVPESTIVSMSS